MNEFNKEYSHGCPCSKCPYKGCGPMHDTCDLYLEWRKKVDQRNENERKFHESNDLISNDRKKAIWKNKRYSKNNP